MRALIADAVPLYLLVRTWLGHLILDQTGAEAILARLEGRARWGSVDVYAHLQRKAHPMKRRAEADLRRMAVGRAPKGRLKRALTRVFSDQKVTYINVGHSNLSDEVLSCWSRVPNARIAVLVHDVIPLDHPDMQRPGTVESFRTRMQNVARYADVVICISEETRSRAAHWFGDWEATPEMVVAHNGVDVPLPDPSGLPEHLPPEGAYFVCAGTIEPRKNHALLLDVWDDLVRTEDIVPALVIAGARGWQNEAVFRRLDARPPHVIEAPGLSDSALAALIQRSSGVLFPSLAEGFGLPPAESLALGVPVICSDLSVLREFLGNSPIYAPVDDMYLWKQSILRMAGQFEETTEAEVGKVGGFERPTWAAHFNLVLKVI